MKRIILATCALLITLTAQAQQRPGGGPDQQDPDAKIVDSFLRTMNKNAKNCASPSTKFETTVDIQVLYNVHYAKEKNSPECGENGIPSLFKCLLDENAQSLLESVIKNDYYHAGSSSLSNHLKILAISKEDRKKNVQFLTDLSEKLSKEKTKP